MSVCVFFNLGRAGLLQRDQVRPQATNGGDHERTPDGPIVTRANVFRMTIHAHIVGRDSHTRGPRGRRRPGTFGGRRSISSGAATTAGTTNIRSSPAAITIRSGRVGCCSRQGWMVKLARHTKIALFIQRIMLANRHAWAPWIFSQLRVTVATIMTLWTRPCCNENRARLFQFWCTWSTWTFSGAGGLGVPSRLAVPGRLGVPRRLGVSGRLGVPGRTPAACVSRISRLLSGGILFVTRACVVSWRLRLICTPDCVPVI